MRIGQTAQFLPGLNVFFGFNLVANSITIGKGYNFLRTGLACFILRQLMVVERLLIAITNGPMQHIKACDPGQMLPFVLPTAAFYGGCFSVQI